MGNSQSISKQLETQAAQAQDAALAQEKADALAQTQQDAIVKKDIEEVIDSFSVSFAGWVCKGDKI